MQRSFAGSATMVMMSFGLRNRTRVITDDRVLAIAEEHSRVLITGDTDFGEVVFRQGRANAGVLLLRLAGLAPERKASIISKVVLKHLPELKGAFSVVAPGQIRIRKPGTARTL
jgi:predicted nuclease of predicted toxin-antitoxin system